MHFYMNTFLTTTYTQRMFLELKKTKQLNSLINLALPMCDKNVLKLEGKFVEN